MELSFKYVQSHFGKVVIVLFLVLLVWCLWPRNVAQVNKPIVSGVAFPGAYVAPDQRSTQIQVVEKSWEVSFDVLGGRVGDKNLYGGRVGLKYKF